MHIERRLAQLELVLPDAPRPVASYVPAVRTGNLIFVSGQIPVANGELLARGSVPGSTSMEDATACARQCVLNALAVLRDHLGSLDKITRVVRLGVFVSSDEGFTSQSTVANGASDLLVEIFGEHGRHARAAVGSIALPLGAPVEVEMVVEVA